MKIGFIGYGNMAKAMARRLNTLKNYTLMASAPSLSPGVNKDNILTHHDNSEVAKHVDVLILAVKPAQMGDVIKEITPSLQHGVLVISVAAGISLEFLSKHFQGNQAIVRCMPNTPASIGMAATAMIANKAVNSSQKQLAEDLLSSIGITAWATKEDEMDTYTALSGSGPAYVFLFVESLIRSAIELGLNPPIAETFAYQTVLGSIQLAKESRLQLSELRQKVTSPGGTTAAALAVLDERLPDLIQEAMRSAKERAHELGKS